MIDRVERTLRRFRRATDPGRIVALLHGDARTGVEGIDAADADGLLVIQIDGLSGARLREAIDDGDLPFLSRLIGAGELCVVPWFPGLPSTTPAVQAELFYGIPNAVPSFAYVDRSSGRVARMYQRDAVVAVERGLSRRSTGSVLEGGGSFGNVYAAVAADAHHCVATLGPRDVVPDGRPWALPLVVAGHLPALVRTALLATGELLSSPREFLVALRAGEDRRAELNLVQSRVAVGVVLREFVVMGMNVAMAHGLPIVHGNLLGYDECAHRRGPHSPIARRALRATDAAVERLWWAAHRGSRRHYDVWVLSDHGQETTDSYIDLHGETVDDAIHRVIRDLALFDDVPTPLEVVPRTGVGMQRVRMLGDRLFGHLVPGVEMADARHRPGDLTVTALGPIGQVYTPRAMSDVELEQVAAAVASDAHVPLVLHRSTTDGEVVAHTARGRFVLPRDAREVLGRDHPYVEMAARDLVAIVEHPDAGDLTISGWRFDRRPLSFPFDHGAHGGPGPAETDAFVAVPPDSRLATDGRGPTVRRGTDLRDAMFAVRRGEDRRRPTRDRDPDRLGERDRPRSVRVLTYNVHSCVGIDGRLSVERVARVIARHDPDVVCLQELDRGRARTGAVDQSRAIADALEMELEFHPTVRHASEEFGDAVLSRHPMRLVRAGGLPGLDRRSLEPRGAIHVEVDVPEADGRTRRLQVVNTHLSLHPRERSMAVDALLGPEWLGAVTSHDVVLCGDFNALAWFPAMRRLRGRLVDAQRGLDGFRPRATWSGRFPIGRIDHVLVDPAMAVLHLGVADDSLARVASDHRPVVVDLVLGDERTTGDPMSRDGG